jgi:ribosomal protein S18
MEHEHCPPTWEFAASVHTDVLLNRKADPVVQENAQLELVDMGRKLDKLQRYITEQREVIQREREALNGTS